MTSANDKEIGFIGLGRMGAPMAGRLLDAGYRLTVYDIDEQAVAALLARGATRAASPRALASAVGTIFLSLPMPDIVTAVGLGADGILSGDKVRIVVDLSTTGPRAEETLARGLKAKGIEVIDCQVSGGVAGANKGTLALMASGRRDCFDAINPALACLGKIFYVGDRPGMAQTMKLINNMISVTALAITSETMVLGAKAGLDADTMIEVINAGSGRTGASVDKIPKFVLPRSFDFGFALGLSAKDIKLCLDECDAQGVPMIVGSAVRQLLSAAKAQFGADADLTTMIKVVEAWAGVEVRGKAAGKKPASKD
jgi:3-hydroxyisobutyrate dehydrogenase-like beta-hydroxyacid dehydrogenase